MWRTGNLLLTVLLAGVEDWVWGSELHLLLVNRFGWIHSFCSLLQSLSLSDRITLHSNFKSWLQRHRRCDVLEWTKSPVWQNLRVGPRLEIILHAYLSNWAITKFRLLLKLYLSEFIRTSIFIAWKIFGSPAWLRFTLMLSDLHQQHSCYNILFSTHTRSL